MPPPSRRGIAQLAVFLLLAVGLPALIPYKQKDKVKSSRDAISIDDERTRLDAEKPEVIIIGDSMVPCRVDKDILSRETSEKTSLLAFHGSASAAWFLLFKNVVATMDNPPAKVVFFFRDTYFHMPRYRTTGQRVALLESLKLGAEPELDMTLKGNPAAGNPVLNTAEDILDATWEIDGYRDLASEQIRETALNAARFHSTGSELNAYLEEAFHIKNLRRDLAADVADLTDGMEHADSPFPVWSTSPLETFLPHIEKLAAEKNIQLVFYRVKQRRHTRPENKEPARLIAYLEGFQNWTRQAGHQYADETIDAQILEKHFADGDHTNEEDKPFITIRVAAALKSAATP